MGKLGGFIEFHRRLPPRRPVAERLHDYREVYLPWPVDSLRGRAARWMGCGIPVCRQGCALGNLSPEWNDLVWRNDWETAIQRLHATNNFPEFTGRLCPAPCEPACVLSINDDPVTIKQVEVSIVDRAFEEGWVRAAPPAHRTGGRVAVVGSGPAGLACAQQLNRAGHQVTVYEKDDRLGNVHREGCASVHQFELLPPPPEERAPDNPWPQWSVIMRSSSAHEEGGVRDYSIQTTGLSGSDGRVERLHGVRVEAIRADGRMRFEPIEGSDFTIEADLVLLAMGFLGPVRPGVVEELGVALDGRGNIVTDADYQTTVPRVFAAGDARRGQSLIVWAIAEGRQAARGCDRVLMGSTRLP